MSEPARPSRRAVLKIIAVGGAAGLGATYAFTARRRDPVTRSRELMGTRVHLTVVDDDRERAEAAADATLARMAALEGELSRYRADSAVGRLNASGAIDDAPESLLAVLALANEIHALGDGAFDITVQPVLDAYRNRLGEAHELPADAALEAAVGRVDQRRLRIDGRRVALDTGMRITLDGIAKGHIVDAGVAELRARGLSNVLVEAGGDLVAGGRKAAGTPWSIGIRRPRPGGAALQARLDARDVAVATSGDYMQAFTPDFRQHHILDPRTGRSAPELASATVVAPTAAEADALATLCMVAGSRRALDLLAARDGCEGYFVTKSLEVNKTPGFVLA
ncbi:MAG: FAD:protein FMN transferase [Planctomycetota bacterium]|jgi:thiamine biosynthesis lipoprotein